MLEVVVSLDTGHHYKLSIRDTRSLLVLNHLGITPEVEVIIEVLTEVATNMVVVLEEGARISPFHLHRTNQITNEVLRRPTFKSSRRLPFQVVQHTGLKNIRNILDPSLPLKIKIEQNLNLPVAGRLRHFQTFWQENIRDKWAKQNSLSGICNRNFNLFHPFKNIQNGQFFQRSNISYSGKK